MIRRKTLELLCAKPVEVLVLEIVIGGSQARGMRLLERLLSEFPRVRAFVFTSCGDEHILHSLSEAFEIARVRGLDLVEIGPDKSPPTCRLIDYGKFQFQMAQQRKGGSR